jgi:SAM-dependent methyltransferase
MINKLIGILKSSSLAKKYLEPIILSALEENFHFDKTIIGHFKDSRGIDHPLYSGLRDKIKPGWRTMLNPDNAYRIPKSAELKSQLRDAKRNIRNLKRIISSFNISLDEKSILEIGCYNGIKTFLLGLDNCSSVMGSDVSFYYEKQSSRNEKNFDSFLSKYRTAVKSLVGESENKLLDKKVSFIEDDISKTKLEENSFDIIVSWETLEHIIDIDSAFSNIRRILKNGGIAFHEYNPFFSLNGGHSLCTLDFPWGHCRLSENDFSNYIREYRPNEVGFAQKFFSESLNRMTMNDLKTASERAGLKILSIIPFVKKAHLTIYNNTVLHETQQNYPTVDTMDFISPVVWVIHQKI